MKALFFKKKKRPESAPAQTISDAPILRDPVMALSPSLETKESLMEDVLVSFDSMLTAEPEIIQPKPLNANTSNTYLSYKLNQNGSRSSVPALTREPSVSSGSDDVAESIRSLLLRSTVDDAKDIIRIIQRDSICKRAP